MSETVSDKEDDLSAAIRDFITGQHQTPQPPTPELVEPEPESERAPEQQPSRRSTQQPSPRPSPRPEPPAQITFVYEGEEVQLAENEATPTAVADHFELDRNEIQLSRNERIFTIHPTEDRFKPNLKSGKTYTVLRTIRSQQSLRRPGASERANKTTRNCTLIANGQKKPIRAGVVTKNAIANAFGINKASDIRLIEYEGNVINNKQQYDLIRGETYYVIYNAQDILENDNDDEVIDEAGEKFSKPMAFIAPFMVAIVRILYALSFTGDAITFTAATTTDQKPTKSKSTQPKLICSNMLSTCAYQVAYRFNTALKAIQKFSNIVRSDDRDETSPLFADERESEAFCHLIDNIVNLLEKAHGELEEFLQIVLTEMRALKPTVESVKASLKIETNQETRKSEKEELLKNDQQVLFEKCDKVYDNDEEIRPTDVVLYTVSSNRRSLNFANDLVEKILHEFSDNNNTAILEDITNLLDFCAKVSHCNIMHWIFAYNLFQNISEENNDDLADTVECRKKIYVAKQLNYAIQIWKNISHGVPLFANLNEETADIHEHWQKLKEAITTSQYALEICHDDESLN